MFRTLIKAALLALMVAPACLAADVSGTLPKVKKVDLAGASAFQFRKAQGSLSFLPSNVGAVKVKAYDAEVEYLESTGTQYIKTGVYTTGPMTFRISATFTPTAAENDLFGAYQTRVNGNIVCGIYSKFAFGFNNPNARIDSATLGSAEMYADIEYSLGESSRTLTVNGTTYNGTGATYNTANEVLVFRANPAVNGAFKCHAFKILDAQGNLVRDYIPVRVGATGYFYDKVSGRIFGNAGTGDFATGPDLDSIAKGYVQDGLFILWDGIENAGWGQHDDQAYCLSTSKYYPSDAYQGWRNLVFNSVDKVRIGGYSFSPVGTPNEELQQNGSYKTQGAWTNNAFIVSMAGSFVTPYAYFYALSSNDWTQSALIKRPSSTALWGIRCGNTYVQSNRLTYSYDNNGTVVQTTAATALPSELYGQPHELTVAVKGRDAKVRFYIDGELYAEETLLGPPINRQLIPGFNLSADTWVYNLRYYNRLLSDDEIWRNHLVDRRRFSLP